jgi:hypothetical protein
MLVINHQSFKHFKGENMEKAKVLRNLEKLLNRDFGFITVGRILIVADNKNITEDLLNSICFRLNIEPNRIDKTDLIKIIDCIKGLKNIE